MTGHPRKPRRLPALLAAAAIALLALPAGAAAAPELEIDSTHQPPISPVPQGTHAIYELTVSNSGDEATSDDVIARLLVPAGLKVTAVSVPGGWKKCEISSSSNAANCKGPQAAIGPGEEACEGEGGCPISVTVRADPEAPLGEYSPSITVCGGGDTICTAPADSASDPIEVVPFGMGLTGFDGLVLDALGDAESQAGGRPHLATTEFSLKTYLAANGEQRSTDPLKDATVELPPGLVGNPQAYPTCTVTQIATGNWGSGCPSESRVGTAVVYFNGNSGAPDDPEPTTVAVFNLKAPFGLPALFGFNFLGNIVKVFGGVRTGEDYGVTVTSTNAPETFDIAGVDFEFWGVPADSEHDSERCVDSGGSFSPCPSEEPLRPFVSLPTSCGGPVETSLTVTGWLGGSASASFLSHDNAEPPSPIGGEGCGEVPFDPSLEARPTTNAGDSPSGFDVSLKVPQSEECAEEGPLVVCEPATAHLRDTTVTLPEGLTVNPSSANGLGACSEDEFGFTGTDGDVIHTTPDPAECPADSKLGTVEVRTPLLDHAIKGAVYLAEPHENPFGSLLALYVAVHDPQTDVVAKLAGEVELDEDTGRISATFKQNPQLPFEEFDLDFFGGAAGALRTPAVCGNHTTRSSLTPWSAPAGDTEHPSDTWAIEQSCAGSEGELPHAPGFAVGSVLPIAGADSPFAVRLHRNDGSQNLSGVDISPPPGLLAKLAGTQICPDAFLAAAEGKDGRDEQANPSCPPTSRLGRVIAAAGAGPAPFQAPGTAYLAGPYKGAPLSVAVITPAVAGPFDLGNVVVRIATHVDPSTARITAVADPLPEILEGVPLDVRAVDLVLDKPQFTRNPTNCDPLEVAGLLVSTIGTVAQLKERFQVAECGRLLFKPRMLLRLFGKTHRGAYQGVRAVVRPRPGDANISRVVTRFPRSAFVAQEHIRTVCTRVQFAADACPKGSVYGRAIAWSPLLDYPLRGPVYLRSSDNELPDAVADLRGPAHQPVRIEVAVRNDSVKGALRNTVQVVPDAPVSYFRLQLFGKGKGLIVNSRNICQGPNRAKVALGAHNGKRAVLRPRALNRRCAKGRRGKR